MSEVKNPILVYAESYRTMIRVAIADQTPTDVSMYSVAVDIEHNMAPLWDAQRLRADTAEAEFLECKDSLRFVVIARDAFDEQLSRWQEIAKAEGDLRSAEQQKLAAAEQHIADLTKAIGDAEYRADQGKVWSGMGWTHTGLSAHAQQKVIDILHAALNPNPEAESHE